MRITSRSPIWKRLNAAMAVIWWKKRCGFYFDLEHEHYCTYTIDGNALWNGDLRV